MSQLVSASLIVPTVTAFTYWLPLPPLCTVIVTSPVLHPASDCPAVVALSVIPVAEPTVADPSPEPLAVKYANAVVASPTAHGNDCQQKHPLLLQVLSHYPLPS